mmetsp:Transcript_4839/g.18094  ORF Transcript_4839/g.18094 Transcript_4839/m.18094 type:complete len:232 (-) Transcript_4839:993-1688(-)
MMWIEPTPTRCVGECIVFPHPHNTPKKFDGNIPAKLGKCRCVRGWVATILDFVVLFFPALFGIENFSREHLIARHVEHLLLNLFLQIRRNALENFWSILWFRSESLFHKLAHKLLSCKSTHILSWSLVVGHSVVGAVHRPVKETQFHDRVLIWKQTFANEMNHTGKVDISVWLGEIFSLVLLAFHLVVNVLVTHVRDTVVDVNTRNLWNKIISHKIEDENKVVDDSLEIHV